MLFTKENELGVGVRKAGSATSRPCGPGLVLPLLLLPPLHEVVDLRDVPNSLWYVLALSGLRTSSQSNYLVNADRGIISLGWESRFYFLALNNRDCSSPKAVNKPPKIAKSCGGGQGRRRKSSSADLKQSSLFSPLTIGFLKICIFPQYELHFVLLTQTNGMKTVPGKVQLLIIENKQKRSGPWEVSPAS